MSLIFVPYRQSVQCCTFGTATKHRPRQSRYVRSRFDPTQTPSISKSSRATKYSVDTISQVSKYDQYIKHIKPYNYNNNNFTENKQSNSTYKHPHKHGNATTQHDRNNTMSPCQHTVPGYGVVLYGRHSVRCALYTAKRKFYTLYLQTNSQHDHNDIVELVRSNGNFTIKYVKRNELDELTNHSLHNGVVLHCGVLPVNTITSIQQLHYDNAVPTQHNYLVLNELHDPMNIGNILRSSQYFNIHTVILSTNKSAPLNSIVSKASSGAMELINIVYCSSINDLLLDIITNTSNEYNIIGLTSSANDHVINCHTYHNTSSQHKHNVIVVGNEGVGLKQHIIKHCNTLLTIPSLQTTSDHNQLVDSLNVSNAVAIVLYEITRSTRT